MKNLSQLTSVGFPSFSPSRAILIPLVFGMLIFSTFEVSAQFSSSGNVPWAIDCSNFGSRNCYLTYKKFFDRVESELRGSSAFFESRGFGNAEFAMKSPKGEGNGVRGPFLRVYKGKKIGLSLDVREGPERCKAAEGPTELASYVSGKGKFLGEIQLPNIPLYQMFDEKPDLEGMKGENGRSMGFEPCSFDSSILRQLIKTLSHETFHAYQGFSKDSLKSSGSINWINEAAAEAAAHAYTKRIMGSAGFGDDATYYDYPLNKDGYEYDRGHFMYGIGKMIDSGAPIRWMTKLYGANSKATTTRKGYDWLDEQLKTTRLKSLSEAYFKFIAKEADKSKFYFDSSKLLAVNQRDKAPVKKDSSVKEMAADPFYTDFKAGVFKKVPDAEPGEYAAFLETEIIANNDKAKMVLIVTNDIAKKKKRRKHGILAALDGKRKTFLNRAANAPDKDDPVGKQAYKVETTAKTVQFSVNKCVAPNKKQSIMFLPERPDVEIKMFAKRGKIDSDYNYTSPATDGEDILEVELSTLKQNGKGKVNIQKKRFIFAKVKVTKRGCHFRWTAPGGYVFTYDTGSKLTEARQGSQRIIFDREFAYVNDKSMGWIKIRPNQMLAMMKIMPKGNGGIPGLGQIDSIVGKLETKAGADPLKWGRAPYDFFEMLERSNLRKYTRRKKPKIVDQGKLACPTAPGVCTVYRISGTDSVFYDRSNRIVALLIRGKFNKVEYGYYPLSVPKNARLISF